MSLNWSWTCFTCPPLQHRCGWFWFDPINQKHFLVLHSSVYLAGPCQKVIFKNPCRVKWIWECVIVCTCCEQFPWPQEEFSSVTQSDQQVNQKASMKKSVIKFKMEQNLHIQATKVTVSLHKILLWSLFYLVCAETKQKMYKCRLVESAAWHNLRFWCSAQRQRKICSGCVQDRGDLQIIDLCLFHMFTFSVVVCQRDWEAANRERMMWRLHSLLLYSSLNSPEISALILLFTFCVTLLCFGFYKLKPRVLKLRKGAETLSFTGDRCFPPRAWSQMFSRCPSWEDAELWRLLQLMSSNLAPSKHTCIIILSGINVGFFWCVVDMELVFFSVQIHTFLKKKPTVLMPGLWYTKNKFTCLANPEHKGTQGIWPKVLSYL